MWGEYLIWRKQKMRKSLLEEMGGKYKNQGDYLITCIALPAKK